MKGLVSFITVILIFSTFSFYPEQTRAEGFSATVAYDNVNMREGPGLSYPTVTMGKKGDTYEILDEDYGWLKLKLSNGQEGWVAQWLTVQESSSEASSFSSDLRTVTADELRIRSGASTEDEVVGTLVSGDTVTVQSSSGDWLNVSTADGINGWVYAQYVGSSGEATESQEETGSDNSEQGTISVNRLNVRNDFSSTGEVIGTLNQGDTVRIEEEQYGWLLVEGNGVKGWVSSTYVRYQSAPSEASEAPETSTITDSSIVINADTLTVRDNPSHDGEAIGQVNQGEGYTVIETSSDWYKIEFSNGNEGWIASWYTEQGSGTTPSILSGENTETVTILYNGSNVRAEPNVESNVIARAQSGEDYSVLSKQNDWFEIELSDGTTGFIANWIVSSDGESAEVEEQTDVTEEQEEAPVEKEVLSIEDATIIIDAGHGGRDGGAEGASGALEKALTLRTAEILYHKLSSTGAKVVMTRQDDRYIDLHARVAAAEQEQADAFVSIHYDAIDDRSIRGYTTYFYGGVDHPLAESVHSGLEGQMTIRNRGVQFGNYLVLRDNSVPSVLLELGYISNPSEEALINNDQFREIAATGIYNGLVDYFAQ